MNDDPDLIDVVAQDASGVAADADQVSGDDVGNSLDQAVDQAPAKEVSSEEVAFLFPDFQREQPVEVVKLPTQGSSVEYLAKVLCARDYTHNEDLRKAAQQYLDFSKQQGKRYAAMLKTLRAVLYLDHGKRDYWEPRRDFETLDDKGLQNEFNFTILQAAMEWFTNDNFPRNNDSFRDHLVEFALMVQGMNARAAEKALQGRGDFLLRHGHGGHDYMGDRVGLAVREHDQDRCQVYSAKTFKGAEDIAQKLLDLYPLLQDREILGQIGNEHDLCYTITAGFAPEMIQHPELKQGVVAVVRSQAPSRLKLATAMMCINQDNCLRVCDAVAQLDEERVDQYE